MNNRTRTLLALVFIFALMLTVWQVPIASSQGATLIAARVTEKLPLDADSPLWQKASAVNVPLSAQVVTPPILQQTNVKAVTARALYNETQIAFLVEWADKTKNADMIRVQDFRDAVALQFPLATGQTFVCMGQQGTNVNIWHWKADWQADIAGWQDMETRYPNMNVDQYPWTKTAKMITPGDYTDPNYVPAAAANNLFALPRTSPVEDLVAGGFGSLTSKGANAQNVQGAGAWKTDQWRVVFVRDLAGKGADDVSFDTSKEFSLAFAAWDGANAERNGQKSVSNWVTLQFQSAADAYKITIPTVDSNTILIALAVVAVLTVLIGGLASSGKKQTSESSESAEHSGH